MSSPEAEARPNVEPEPEAGPKSIPPPSLPGPAEKLPSPRKTVVIELERVVIFCEAKNSRAVCEAYEKRPENKYDVFFDVKDGLVRYSHLDPATHDFKVVDPQPPKIWEGSVAAILLSVSAKIEGENGALGVLVDRK